MIIASLAALALVAQDPPSGETSPTYTPPPVRPFEPPSDFGRETSQGDAESRPTRGPLSRAVPVDVYAGQYEAEPTAAEAGYAQGVAGAELSMDALAGPLDGRWSVVDPQGRPMARIALSDPGPGLAPEGAWRAVVGPGRGVVATVAREPGTVELTLDGFGVLKLRGDGGGWGGVLVDADGRDRPVRLVR